MDNNFGKNEEINNVLKEFESKASFKQKPQQGMMSISEAPTMVQWVMKFSGGYIKSKKQAEYVLLVCSLLILTISFVIIKDTVSISQKPKVIPHFREDIDPAVHAKLPPGVLETIPSKYDQQ